MAIIADRAFRIVSTVVVVVRFKRTSENWMANVVRTAVGIVTNQELTRDTSARQTLVAIRAVVTVVA